MVSMMPAMPQALVSPDRVTFAGSSTPAAMRSSTLSSSCMQSIAQLTMSGV